jgi:4-hydroxy-4-methyl-2-oxoglutarate aldolase
MDRQNSMRHTVQPLFPGARTCGPALTVKAPPGDNLIVHKSLQLARPGDVLVIATGGHLEGAPWGELLSLSAKQRGVAGVVIEGAVRDREAITRLGLPVFCSAVLPGGTHKANPGSLNVPIAVAGAAVSPGDLVIGDGDGVVVVPRLEAPSVLERARAILKKEAWLREQILAGELLFEVLELNGLLTRPDVLESGRITGSQESGGRATKED